MVRHKITLLSPLSSLLAFARTFDTINMLAGRRTAIEAVYSVLRPFTEHMLLRWKLTGFDFTYESSDGIANR
ncbi:hypothetical protein D3C86_2127010 [compost metagenome]